MTLITEIRLRKVLDSRGNATVEADVSTESGGFGRASAPSGASTGEYEAIELPAGEAIAQARSIAIPRLEGKVYAGDQRSVDRALRETDGTDNFGEIGANSAVAISMAAAKAGADMLGAPLYQHLGGAFRGESYPTPLGNAIGGGEHATGGTDIQEFLAVPTGAPSVSDAVFANASVHQTVHELLSERGIPAEKSDEGAWSPSIADSKAFEIMAEATEIVSDEVGFTVRFGIDAAASELFDGDDYQYTHGHGDGDGDGGGGGGVESRTTDEQIAYIADLVAEYDLAYVEDPLEENEYAGFAELTARVGDRTIVCGDDLFVTNTDRLAEGIEQDAGNSILVKPNQIGTLTDAFDAVELAVENGYVPVISHRSGETEDTTIAHLAVATAAPYIKTGAVGGERTAKLNELIRIETNA